MSASLFGKQIKNNYDVFKVDERLREWMSGVFDRIVIAVPDLSEATSQYQSLLGVEQFDALSDKGAPKAWWGFSNTVIELVQREVETSRIEGIVFNSPQAQCGEGLVESSLDLDICVGDGQQTAEFRLSSPQLQIPRLKVDHLVLRTDDADACIELFSGVLDIRLALDKTAPDWGGRMLFFRAGKLTLEVIESDSEDARGNFFWGIAYQCPDIESASAEFMARGVALSPVRQGRKPGTRVASIKSHCLQIPTLLIEPAN